MSQENKAYIAQLVKQIVHPYFAEEIADILIAHGMTFKTDPQTNADRIRAMTDEELAELFHAIVDDGQSCTTICDNYDRCKRNNAWEPICKNHYLKWLQQLAE